MMTETSSKIEDIYPLTPMQSGMLFHSLYLPQSQTYFSQLIYDFDGNLKVEFFKIAWLQVCKSMTTFRTAFIWQDGEEPEQYVLEDIELPFEVLDWQYLGEQEQQQKLETFIQEDRKKGLDLGKPPLFRLTLIQCAENRYYLLWSQHHILLDGWCHPIILSDVLKTYEALIQGKVPQLPFRRPFRDYIAWLQNQDINEAEAFWKKSLLGIEGPTHISFKDLIPHNSETKQNYDSYFSIFSEEETDKLRTFTQKHHLTLNTLLQAAVGAVLKAYTRQEEVLLGVTVSGRNIDLPGIEDMVGLFINTLPLRISFNPQEDPLSFLHSLQKRAQEINDFAYASLAQIQSWSGHHKSLFDVLFIFENYPLDEASSSSESSVKIKDVRGIEKTEYPLTVAVTPGKELHLELSYQTEHFNEEIIKRFSGHLKQILRELTLSGQGNSFQPIQELPLLTQEEQHQLLVEWNDTKTDYPMDKTVHQLFEEQVEKTPNNTAVVFENQSLTYNELNKRTNQLAHYLRDQGVGTDTLVALAVDRSLEMITGLLAILKAGGAYVPLDPSYPQDRLRYMLEDTQTSILLTQPHLKKQFKDYEGKILCVQLEQSGAEDVGSTKVKLFEGTKEPLIKETVEETWITLSSTTIKNLFPFASPFNLAYVIYTSGSAGKPKGVMIQHKSLTNLLMTIQAKTDITGHDNLFSVTTVAFDIATLELFLPLITGSTLILPSKEILLDPYMVQETLSFSNTTISQATPSFWQSIINQYENVDRIGFKVLCGGEAISISLLKAILRKADNLWNLYGPTETTIWSTYKNYHSKQSIAKVSIGQPLDNTQIHILDPNLNPVPLGVSGEVYIGGDGLARGYLNRPGLTADRFVPNPFVYEEAGEQRSRQEANSRLYRTGDLARYLSDGNIEFLGRIDDQVKIRGFRIELGEIESILSSHSDVDQAVVTAREDERGHKQLVAYIILQKNHSHTSDSQARVSRWKSVYDTVYKDVKQAEDVIFNTVGWNSSYSGEPMPETEMAEWMNNTVHQINSLKPQRVLEIGCGTGLLLLRIAPHCEAYWGTDISANVINHLEILKDKKPSIKHIHLLRREANNFEGVSRGYFDVVVLNSVVQYFPNINYLKDVLKGAAGSLREGGVIFIGDVRNLSLLKAFYTSIEHARASGDKTKAQMEKEINQRMEEENELVIAPRFFTAILDELKEISHIRIEPKKGQCENELTKFRYDVFLYVHSEIHTQKIEWSDWESTKHSLNNIETTLTKKHPVSYGLKHVNNMRLQKENEILSWLNKVDEEALLKELNLVLPTLTSAGINPEDLWKLGKRLGYRAEISWCNDYEDGAYDVAFTKEDSSTVDTSIDFHLSSASFEPVNYANDPSQNVGNIDRSLHFQEYLAQSLPDHMIPSFFVFLDRIPLTSNGKVDRKSLPAPDLSLRVVEKEYVPPQTILQKEFCSIWSEVLNIEEIGIHDNFFRIGGHSLLATQAISRIRHSLDIDVSLRDLFDHPTIASLSKQVEELQRTHYHAIMPPITAQERPEHIPVSFSQQRLWFIGQLLDNKALYNIPLAFTLKGMLNVIALEKALNALIDRHEALRTVFASHQEGKVSQVILPRLTLDLQDAYVDFSHLPQEKQRPKAASLAQQETMFAFDLSSGPLIRTKLVKLKEKEHLFFLTLHHIISDGWSMNLLFKELSHFYNAFVINEEPTLPPLPLQYADFSIWQRHWLQGDVLDQQVSYWKEQLSDIPDLLQLPTDKPRSKEMTYRGEVLSRFLDKDLKDKLDTLSREHNVSLFMTLLTAFQTLLYRYTGQSNIVVGSPIANRHYKETEDLIGFFVNTLALKTSFDNTDCFLDVLRKVKTTTLSAYQHQDLPFEHLLEHLDVNRELNRNPVFQVWFFTENASERINLTLSDLQAEPTYISSPIAKFDLTVCAFEDKEGMSLEFGYSTDLFEKGTVERMANNFLELIQGILDNPNCSVQELPLLTTEEQQLLVEWNDTKTDYPMDKTVHQLFEEQVERTPNNIALTFEGKSLTYTELNQRVNRLAHYLQEQGVGPDIPVAFAVDRSLEMITTLLAIIKAGGAYVPLDPSYPQDRLQYMLEDTQAPILLTQPHLKERFKDYDNKTLCVQLTDESKELLINGLNVQASSENPPIVVSPHNLAYVIYTSGSTGKPKGVMVNYKNLTHYLRYAQNTYPTSQGTTLLHSSVAFDMSVTSLFLSLISGGKVEILSESMNADSLDLILKKASDFNFIKLTPSHLRALKDSLTSQQINASDKCLVVGGENLLAEDIGLWTDNLSPNLSFFNEYGPTEATVGCCVYKLCDNDTPSDSPSIPIGQPIYNTQIHILDESLNSVPIGVSGEIYVGGEGLARGYLNRPDLTADRFVPNPFVSEDANQQRTNLRLYRTGDLARYLPDGNIEFLGRIDDQVKIRGFRIELGEIESTLASHGDVNQTFITAWEDDLGYKQLVAYVVPGDFTPSTIELREYLEETLPEYMIPSFFVILDQIPLTSNGKVDRRFLPAPDLSVRVMESEYVTPQTTLQEELCSIWSEVLNIEEIGIHDNFFKIGGHSLLATQVISRMRHFFEIDVPLRELFEHPTIASLSKQIEKLQQTHSHTLIPPISVQKRPEHVPLSFAQQRLWFLEQLIEDKPLYNIPLAFSLEGRLNVDTLQKALVALSDRHEALRTVFILHQEGSVSQAILPRLTLNIEDAFVDLSHLSPEEQQSKAATAAQKEITLPFDLSSGPLMRTKLIKIGEKEHLILLTLHHIISDGWSIGILLKELSHFYNAFASNEEPTLPPLDLQYADFSIWQRKWLQGDVLDLQLSYWKNQLSDIPDLLQLPTDRPRPKEITYRGEVLSRFLGKDLKDKLDTLSREHNASLFMTLLTAFQTLLYRYTGQSNIVVGSPIANRHYKETEDLIGLFVNTLALKASFDHTDTFLDVLKKVKKTTLSAYQHQDLPFEQLVDHLNVKRSININPVFQSMFMFENASEQKELVLGDLKAKPYFATSSIAKFDLTVCAFEDREGISLEFGYSTDLFEKGTVERMANNFLELIQGILDNPNCSVQELPLLTTEEQQLLVEWNDTKTDYPMDKTVHQLFEEQVEKTPNNTAVVFENQSLTYSELNKRANQLAHYLRNQGVGTDTLVALAVDRSLEMITGLLAILKAGGAYVPLDPSYPQDRLQYMLEDTQAPILLTQFHLKEQFKNYQGRSLCIQLTEENQKLLINGSNLQLPTTNLQSFTLPHHLAYIIYTSGSTGKPKGVMIQHKNVIRLFSSTSDNYRFTSVDVWTLFHSYAFDVSVWEIWGALLYGGKLIIVDYLSSRSPNLVYGLIVKHGVTILNQTPSSFKQLVNYQETLSNSKLSNLRFVILAGEALEPKSLTPWYKKQTFQQPQIVNMYGITETTVHVTFRPVDEKLLQNGLQSNIGKPISDLCSYILDISLNPVPIGVSGEIYVGGEGLARGYLNRPDLTADRFVPNPFASEEDREQQRNLRLYRTGDLARYLPDGNIEFLGRIDDQVKIRGFRIELGEIESTIASHREVIQSVVTVREDEPGHKYLVAYVVLGEEICSSLSILETFSSSSQQEFSVLGGKSLASLTESLRNKLAQSLPDYMIPSFFVFLDQIPLTSNGKADRKSLPTPDFSLRLVTDEYMAPQTALQKQLCSIWTDVLKIEKIGIKDNFFKIGGDSLLAIQLIARMNSKLKKDLKVLDLFSNQTIFSLSASIETALNQMPTSPLFPIRTKGKVPAFFLIHPAGGLAFEYTQLSNVSDTLLMYGINSPHYSDPQNSPSNIEKVAEAYIKLMKTVQKSGPYVLGGWSSGGLIAYEMAQQLHNSREQIEGVIMVDTATPEYCIAYEKSYKESEYPNVNIPGFEDVDLERIMRMNAENTKPKVMNYLPKPYPGKVVLLKADNKVKNSLKSFVYYGWKDFIKNLEVISIPGSHNTLFDKETIQSTAENLRHGLKKLGLK